jgi:hypothetical protein
MTLKKNPLKLNALQLRTLTVLQVLAQVRGAATAGPQPGEITIARFPAAHGDHFHLGDYLVNGRDASGLYNQAVWNALSRKGLARADWPTAITLTPDGLAYDTGVADEILKPASH